MPKEPLRIRIPATLFQGHETSFRLQSAKALEGHQVIDVSSDGTLTLPAGQQVRSVRLMRDEEGNLYLEMEE